VDQLRWVKFGRSDDAAAAAAVLDHGEAMNCPTVPGPKKTDEPGSGDALHRGHGHTEPPLRVRNTRPGFVALHHDGTNCNL
jgi:hypothetical protein